MKINILRVNHITIAAPKNLKNKMVDFYTKILGFKVVENPHAFHDIYDVVWFERPNIRLHIDFRDAVHPAGLERHFAVEVEDLAGIRKFFNANNVTIKEDLEVPECTRFDMVDPAGNYIEMMELKKP